MFSKTHNIWNRFLPNLVAYLQYFKQRWFLLTFSYILQSLNQQTTLLSSLLRVRISLSTSLYIHFSPILSITCLNKQTNKQRNSTIPLNVNKITVHIKFPKAFCGQCQEYIALRNPAVSPHKVAKTSSYRRETFKMQYSQIQQEIYFSNIKC